MLERTLEHRFLAELTTTLWCSGTFDFAVSRSEVDQYGYDVIVEVGAIVRHIQLKAKARGGKTARVSANLRLAEKASGCIVWMIYDPTTLRIDHFLWFGGAPGQPLPPLGEKVALQAKGDASGYKKPKPGHRIVPIRSFTHIADMKALRTQLFG